MKVHHGADVYFSTTEAQAGNPWKGNSGKGEGKRSAWKNHIQVSGRMNGSGAFQL